MPRNVKLPDALVGDLKKCTQGAIRSELIDGGRVRITIVDTIKIPVEVSRELLRDMKKHPEKAQAVVREYAKSLYHLLSASAKDLSKQLTRWGTVH